MLYDHRPFLSATAIQSNRLDDIDIWTLEEKIAYTFQQEHKKPLHDRCRINPAQDISPTRPTGDPTIILLCLWSQATQCEIEHYISGYRDLFPAAQIVLAEPESALTSIGDCYENVLDILTGTTDSTSTAGDHSVLLHLFGTSGAANACRILRGYQARTSRPLDVGVVIADAEPSASLVTFLSSPQPISATLFSFLLAFWLRLHTCLAFWLAQPSHLQIHHDLNSTSLLPRDVRKCFVFAQHDLMLSWTSSRCDNSRGSARSWTDSPVEEQKRQGYAVKRSSIDQKGRWNANQEKYWTGIANVWEES